MTERASETSALLAHFRAMQEACANYLEPTTYLARHPDLDHVGDCPWVREFSMPHPHASERGAAETNARRDKAFIRDMIYMLDGPEQRDAEAALALATPAPVAAGEGMVRRLLDDLEALEPHLLEQVRYSEPGLKMRAMLSAAPAQSPVSEGAEIERLADEFAKIFSAGRVSAHAPGPHPEPRDWRRRAAKFRAALTNGGDNA